MRRRVVRADGKGRAVTDATVPEVVIDGVTKRYGRTLALDDVSLAVRPNELFALLGPNGAGKTTLLHILCTILKPDSGTARIGGVDVVAQALRARRSLGVVFQEPSLDDRLTVYENLNFHGLVYGVPAARRRSRIDEMLHLVELEEWRDSLVRTLSAGMKRRLEIARALVHDARVLFLDEPTVGLDAQSRGRLWQHVQTLRKKRDLTVIVTTHYIEEVEGCDRVCIIDHGHILTNDTPAALKLVHGQQLIRVVANDEPTAAEIVAAYPDLHGWRAGLAHAFVQIIAVVKKRAASAEGHVHQNFALRKLCLYAVGSLKPGGCEARTRRIGDVAIHVRRV